jgi:cell division inhibitor SepF
MAGAMRKVGVYLGLLEDGTTYDDYDDEHSTDRSGATRYEPRAAERVEVDRRPVRAVRDEDARVAQLAQRRRPVEMSTVSADSVRITTLHPRTYNEARTIGEHFRDGTPVIMNLSEMDDNDAKRLVDFSAGLVFAAHGTIERVTSKVFLLSPPNVSVAAEDKQRIAEGGFFNQS